MSRVTAGEALEKTMILSQFGSQELASPAPEHILKSSRAKGQGGKMARKGVFATASHVVT
jgi:hypothetical protein